MGKYSRLGKNSFFVFVGNIGGKMIAFLMLPFYTRWLSVEDYGTVDMLTGYSVSLCDIITCCICHAIFIFPKNGDEANKQKYFSSGLLLSLFPILILGFLGKIILSYTIAGNNLLNTQYPLIVWMALASFVQNYCQNFVRSLDKMQVYSLIGIIYTGVTAAMSFLLIPLWGVSGYVAAIICASILTTGYTFVRAGLYRYLSFKSISFSHYKEMFNYSFPLVGNIVVTFITTFLNRPFMEQYQGLEAVGSFAVANKFPAIISAFIPVFCLSWQISVIEEFGKKDYAEFYNKTLRALSLLFISGSILLIPGSKLLVWLFASPAYADTWVYIPLLTLATYFSFIGYYAGANFSAAKQSKYFLYSGLITAMASVLLNILLIPNWGIWGTTFSILLSQIFFAASRYYYSRKWVQISQFKEYLLMTGIFLSVTGITLYWDCNWLSYLAAIIGIFILIIANHDLNSTIMKKAYQLYHSKKKQP